MWKPEQELVKVRIRLRIDPLILHQGLVLLRAGRPRYKAVLSPDFTSRAGLMRARRPRYEEE